MLAIPSVAGARSRKHRLLCPHLGYLVRLDGSDVASSWPFNHSTPCDASDDARLGVISTIGTLKGSWRNGGADSLFLDWSDGSSGVSVALERSDAELVGLAKLWSGEVLGVTSWPTDSVHAHRERCR